MSFSIQLGNFLYKYAFVLYKPVYTLFKNRQDSFEITLLKKYIQPGDTVIDIGANIGYYASILSELVGEKGKVHCFEPDEKNFKHLVSCTKTLSNCVINNKAVGPKTEKLKIYTSKNLNVDHRTYKPEEYDKELEIDAVSIDDYVQSHAIKTKVNFIKMDIQGFEMKALMGIKDTLSSNPDIKLISEFWPYGLRKAGSSVSTYYTELQTLGFHCYLLEKDSLKLLDLNQVQALEPLGEEEYFNIFASRSHV